jgi:hypothetical protein
LPVLAELPDVVLWPPAMGGCQGGFGARAGWWRLARCKPNRDKRYIGALAHAGSNYYAPMGGFREVISLPGGGTRERMRVLPLFAGYVFVATDGPLPDASRYLLRLDPIGDQQRIVADLEALHALYLARAAVREDSPLEPGRLVRVKFGNRAGAEGYVDPAPRGNAADGRVYVLLHTLGRWLSVPIERWQLEVA